MVTRQWCRGCQIFLLNAEHELTGHAVYRSWCRHCVSSKGRAHAYSSREEGEFPEIGIDCGYFGRDKEDALPILCVKCRNRSIRCVGATVVDRKGASDNASSFLTAFIKSLGLERILVRSDNERSLWSLIEQCRVGADDVPRGGSSNKRPCREVGCSSNHG